MDKKYIIGIDQSTQGTKALLFDGEGHLLRRTDLPHRQIINEKGGSAAVRAVLHRKLPKKAVRKKFVKQPVCSFPRTSRQQRWHGC